MRKIISTVLTAAFLTVSLSSFVVSAATYQDITGHWAEDCIEAWSGYGVISGFDGYFSPNRFITRGEFAVVLNRTLKYQATADNKFVDLDENFYTDSILKLNEAEVMQGDGTSIRPKDQLTRQEAAVMICRALGIDSEETASKTFADDSEISDWARPYLNALVNKNLLQGSDGCLNPQKSITRAEVVKIMDNAIYPMLSTGEKTGITTDKIVVISADDVTVKDSFLNGGILITQGVSTGNVTISGTQIMGDVSFDNSREKFVKFENCKVSDNSFVNHAGVLSADVTEINSNNQGTTGNGSTGTGVGSIGGSSGSSGGGNSGNSGSGNSSKPKPTATPTITPSTSPSASPTTSPSASPSTSPSASPTTSQSTSPTATPTTSPSESPSATPTTEPSESPSASPTAEPTPTPDYEELNKEMVEKIQSMSDDLAVYLNPDDPDNYEVFYTSERAILKKVKTCMDKSLTYRDTAVIDDDFIKTKFKSEIDDCKKRYEQMEADGTSGQFLEKLAINLNVATLEWLATAFGVM